MYLYHRKEVALEPAHSGPCRQVVFLYRLSLRQVSQYTQRQDVKAVHTETRRQSCTHRDKTSKVYTQRQDVNGVHTETRRQRCTHRDKTSKLYTQRQDVKAVQWNLQAKDMSQEQKNSTYSPVVREKSFTLEVKRHWNYIRIHAGMTQKNMAAHTLGPSVFLLKTHLWYILELQINIYIYIYIYI